MKITIAKDGYHALIKTADDILRKNGGFTEFIPDHIKGQGALSVLKKMLGGNYFDVCPLDDLAKLNNVVMLREHSQFINSLHCVHWCDMTKETKEYLSALLLKYFEVSILKSDSLITIDNA